MSVKKIAIGRSGEEAQSIHGNLGEADKDSGRQKLMPKQPTRQAIREHRSGTDRYVRVAIKILDIR